MQANSGNDVDHGTVFGGSWWVVGNGAQVRLESDGERRWIEPLPSQLLAMLRAVGVDVATGDELAALRACRDELRDTRHRLATQTRIYGLAKAAADRRAPVPLTTAMVTALQKIGWGTWDSPEKTRTLAQEAHQRFIDWKQAKEARRATP